MKMFACYDDDDSKRRIRKVSQTLPITNATYLSTRTPSDPQKWAFDPLVYHPRYLMIAASTVLALVILRPDMQGDDVDMDLKCIANGPYKTLCHRCKGLYAPAY